MRFLVLASAFLLACHLQPAAPKIRAEFNGYKLSRMPPATWQECSAIDRNQVGWAATAAASAGLGGAVSGLHAVFDTDTAKYVLSASGAVFGVLAATSAFLASHYAKRYSDRCTDNQGGSTNP